MNSVFRKITGLSQMVVYGVLLPIMTFLMISSSLYVFDISNMQRNKDSLIGILLAFVSGVLVMFGISFLLEKFGWKCSALLFCSVFAGSILFCAWWIVNAASLR